MRHWPLLPIVALGLWLRLVNLDYGLPAQPHIDEWRVVQNASRIAYSEPRELHPGFFNYPAFQVYLLAGAFNAAELLVPAEAEGTAVRQRDLRLGRALTVAFSAGTVLATYALGWLWGGRATAVVAGLFLAVAPYPALGAHYTNVDTPMTFWLTLAACACLVHVRRGRLAWLLAAAAAIGLATASKYPALASVPMLAAASAGARPGGEPAGRWLANVALAGLVVLAVFSVAAPFSWLDFEGFLQALVGESSHMEEGHLGFDLVPEGWIYQRGIYQLAAGLPFALGIPLYLMALGGLARFVLRPQLAGLVLAAGTVPLFALVCLPTVVFVRYLLPLLPFMAVLAASFGCGLAASSRKPLAALGAASIALTLAYSFAFTWSQLRSIEPQNGTLVAAWIREHVAPGPVSIAGAPGMIVLHESDYQVHRFNLERAQRRRAWPNWLVLSSWYERAYQRGSLRARNEHSFVRALESEASPYSTVARFECSYLNQNVYAALDPSLADQFACLSFSIHRRRAESR